MLPLRARLALRQRLQLQALRQRGVRRKPHGVGLQGLRRPLSQCLARAWPVEQQRAGLGEVPHQNAQH